jgi:hypothetical protein
MPSIVIMYFETSRSKFTPVKVIVSPPSTDPNLGLIADIAGVRDPE